jgi:hypothetical protein
MGAFVDETYGWIDRQNPSSMLSFNALHGENTKSIRPVMNISYKVLWME